MENAKSFKVYFDGKEQDAFRTLFGSATLTHHFNPETFLALQCSSFPTREEETYDISGEYWLEDAISADYFGVGTYMEHARNRLRANVFNTALKFRTRFINHTLQAGVEWQRQSI